MHDISAGENLKGFQELIKILHNLDLREMSIFFDFLIEGASIAVLIKEIKIIDSFEYLDKSDNMRAVYLRQNLYLIEGAFLQFRVIFEALDIDHFNGDFFGVAAVDSSEYFPLLSLADLLVEGVIFNDLDHPLNLISKN